MPVTLLIPHDFMQRPAIGYCGVCEVPFYTEKGMRAHLRSGQHAGQVEIERAAQEAKRSRLSIFYSTDGPGDDPEIAAHLKQVGKRMIAENRWELKKSERAGFS